MKLFASVTAVLFGSAALASAADFYTPPPYAAEVFYTPSAFNWMQASMAALAAMVSSIRSSSTNSSTGQFDLSSGGFFAGGQLGANWQIGQWVLGVEGDAAWSDIKGEIGFEMDGLGSTTDGPAFRLQSG